MTLPKIVKILVVAAGVSAGFTPWVNAEGVKDKRFASAECKISEKFLVECDYRYGSKLDVKEISLKINGKPAQIPEEKIFTYPRNEQTTAILILVDVSDPRRKNTIEYKNIAAILEILKQAKPHQKIGIAEFDSDLRVIAPIGTEIEGLNKSTKEIKASGQSTEFYKNILSGIDLLNKYKSDRKGIIILSDGKDEDRAYKLDDVVRVAKEKNISILGLGYLERPTDSPYLQSLKRLSDETFGMYFDATDQILPKGLNNKPFYFVERGGTIGFELPNIYEKQAINVILGRVNGELIELESSVTPEDPRSDIEKIIDYCKTNWIIVSSGFGFSIIILIALYVFLARKLKKSRKVLYAKLEELNSSGTQHAITKTAIRIGRSKNNDVNIFNDSISLNHAEVHRRREGGFYIVDLSSTNGVYVNEVKVTQGEIQDGDIIELGEIRLRFSIV
jgi:hypothetical protein